MQLNYILTVFHEIRCSLWFSRFPSMHTQVQNSAHSSTEFCSVRILLYFIIINLYTFYFTDHPSFKTGDELNQTTTTNSKLVCFSPPPSPPPPLPPFPTLPHTNHPCPFTPHPHLNHSPLPLPSISPALLPLLQEWMNGWLEWRTWMIVVKSPPSLWSSGSVLSSPSS